MTEVGKIPSGILITEGEHGQRLDNFLLKQCKGVPKSHVYRIVRSGEVRVDGRRAEVSYRLQAGEIVRVPPLRVAAPPDERAMGAAQLRIELPVLYEDDGLLVIDKPAGMAVHGGSGVSFGVIETLRQQRPQSRFLELVHRLDRETSGVLLCSKKRATLLALHEMFREDTLASSGRRGADKRYLVLVAGRWMESLRHVRLPLLKYVLDSGERRVRVAAAGRAAHTVFRLRARWQHYSLLEAQLETGRTHQIRVHLAHLGYPIAGDDKYGDFARNHVLVREGLKRMFLHAWRVRLSHPVDGRELVIEAPLPVALRRFLRTLASKESQDYGEAV